LYIQNDRPQFAQQGPADSVNSPSFQDLLAATKSSELLTPVQQDVFRAPRPEVELYDTQGDPYQISNLAGQAEYADLEKGLREALDFWKEETADSSPEEVSGDYFSNTTGKKLDIKPADFQRPPPGADKGADKVNADGLK